MQGMNDHLIDGQRVQIITPQCREHLSFGTVIHYDFEMNWYSVSLERTEPPFRGYYTRDGLLEVEK